MHFNSEAWHFQLQQKKRKYIIIRCQCAVANFASLLLLLFPVDTAAVYSADD